MCNVCVCVCVRVGAQCIQLGPTEQTNRIFTRGSLERGRSAGAKLCVCVCVCLSVCACVCCVQARRFAIVIVPYRHRPVEREREREAEMALHELFSASFLCAKPLSFTRRARRAGRKL